MKKPLRCILRFHDWEWKTNDEGQHYKICVRCGRLVAAGRLFTIAAFAAVRKRKAAKLTGLELLLLGFGEAEERKPQLHWIRRVVGQRMVPDQVGGWIG
jgi:hypothetical protein